MDSFDEVEIQRLVNKLKNVVTDLYRSAAITDMCIERIEAKINGSSTRDEDWDKFMLNRYIACMNSKNARGYDRLTDKECRIWDDLLNITGGSRLM